MSKKLSPKTLGKLGFDAMWKEPEKTPVMEVTLWSKEPTRNYMPVTIEMCALIDHERTFLILTRPDGMSMGMMLTVAGTESLGKDLTTIHKHFKDSGKDGQWLAK
jgi:hypothetical protein